MNGKSKTPRTKKPSKIISANEYWNAGFKAMNKKAKVIQEQLRQCEKESPELARSFVYLAKFAEISSVRINRNARIFPSSFDFSRTGVVDLEPDVCVLYPWLCENSPGIPDIQDDENTEFDPRPPIATCSTLKEDYLDVLDEMRSIVEKPTITTSDQVRLINLQNQSNWILTQMESIGCISLNLLTPLEPRDFG